MNSKRIKSFMVPIVYGGCVLVFLFSIYFAGRFARRVLFTDDSNLKYVDGEITKEGGNSELPVVSTSSQIVRPYLDNTVSVVKSFYDYKGDSTIQVFSAFDEINKKVALEALKIEFSIFG